MAMTDPSASLAALSDAGLLHAHDRLHEISKTVELSPEEAEAHHLIAEELRQRGLDHPVSDDLLHDVVVTMSTVRVPVRSLAKMLGPNEVDAIAQMAMANGTSFADVYELLTANGWMLRAEPATPATDGEGMDPEDMQPEAEVDDEYRNLNPRQVALAEALEKIAEDHGPFDQTAAGNGAHYIPAADNVFAEAGIKCSNCVFFRGGNMCELVSGEIEPEAACKLWVIDTGLVQKGHGAHDFKSPGTGVHCAVCGQPQDNWRHQVARKADEDTTEAEKSLVVKQVEEQRFTLGPWYVPNALDAHNEWTDPDELQGALWDYVKKGNREIRLQHTPDTRAGEWVEAMTLPFPMECPLIHPETGQMVKRTFPAGTVMLGVQWDDWAWDMVKAGQIRGYSIGGSSERVEADPPILVDLDTGEL